MEADIVEKPRIHEGQRQIRHAAQFYAAFDLHREGIQSIGEQQCHKFRIIFFQCAKKFLRAYSPDRRANLHSLEFQRKQSTRSYQLWRPPLQQRQSTLHCLYILRQYAAMVRSIAARSEVLSLR